ncbi:hypothetical protein [Vibrio coralliirubri]|uniref:hypothetical protein n=1 Tax=Vibrio coralliirubri TaxID=1516159 RepID=UPI002FDFC2A6
MIKLKKEYSNELLEDYYNKGLKYTSKKLKKELKNIDSIEDKYKLWKICSVSNISRLLLIPPYLLECEIEKVEGLYPDFYEYYNIIEYFSSAISYKVNELKIRSVEDKRIFDRECIKLLSIISRSKHQFPTSLVIDYVEKEITNIVNDLTQLTPKSPRSEYKKRIEKLYIIMQGKGIDRFYPTWIPIVKKVFNYSGFIDQKFAIKMTNDLGIGVCPYCNIEGIEPDKPDSNDKVYRPPLDHYYPKSLFPYLSISIYNLIPCCTKCNSTYKGSYDTYKNKYRNPYSSGFCSEVIFEIHDKDRILKDLETGYYDANEIEIICKINDYIGNTEDIFRIEKRYKGQFAWKNAALKILKSYSDSNFGTVFNHGAKIFTKDVYIETVTDYYKGESALRQSGKKYKLDLINQVYGLEDKI